MTTFHGYIGIEDLGLSGSQRQALIKKLKSLGQANHGRRPELINHWRVRLDGLAVIFEASFNPDNVSLASLKGYLANIYNLDPGDIADQLTSQSFSGGLTQIVTFSYNGQARLRAALFGGLMPTWEESRSEVLGFLQANAAAWEEEGP